MNSFSTSAFLYFELVFFRCLADHAGELLFIYLPQLNLVTVQAKLSGLKAQQKYHETNKNDDVDRIKRDSLFFLF